MGVPCGKYHFGSLPCGPKNLITDVPGVLVGHVTLSGEKTQTGITAVLPHGGNLFRHKVPAAAHVINGFGKNVGLVQIQELGTIESPILLTNTFSVGTAMNGLLTYLLDQNPEIGDTTGTVNAPVFECNDGVINHIRCRVLTEEHVLQAIHSATSTFDEGAVGGGRGMICYDLKGGIGSASRVICIGEHRYTIGALLMTNFGRKSDLILCGDPIGKRIANGEKTVDQGSVIVILATDAPLNASQLTRCVKRAQNGLARTGSYTGNHSGEIAVMFSTANQQPHVPTTQSVYAAYLHDDFLDPIFQAVTECVEESVISSMLHAIAMQDRKGNLVHSLTESI